MRSSWASAGARPLTPEMLRLRLQPADQTVDKECHMTYPTGLGVVSEASGCLQLLDVSCGRCRACAAGRTYWCLDPSDEGSALLRLDVMCDADTVRRWVSLMGALVDSPRQADDVILVLSEANPSDVEALVSLWHPGVVHGSFDGRDVGTRTALKAESKTGRAQVVVALRDAKSAVKSVQRGGIVCLPAADVDAPTITELVQRDVRLVGPRDVTGFLAGIDVAVLARHLCAVLTHGPSSARAHA